MVETALHHVLGLIQQSFNRSELILCVWREVLVPSNLTVRLVQHRVELACDGLQLFKHAV